MEAQHTDISSGTIRPIPNYSSLADVNAPRTLLIIDDEKDMCLLLQRALRTRFAQIEFAHSLSEGAAIAVRMSPNVILLDNNLPDGYGINYIDVFRVDNQSVHIVMVSAMDIRYESIEAGADEFIDKPVNISVLKDIIDKKDKTN